MKRRKKNIKHIIYHYTGMKTDKVAIRRLTNFNSKVSCHYYIDRKGNLIQMVPEYVLMGIVLITLPIILLQITKQAKFLKLVQEKELNRSENKSIHIA